MADVFIPSCLGDTHYVSIGSVRKQLCELYNLMVAMSFLAKNHFVIDEIGSKGILGEYNQSYQCQRVSELLIEIAIKVRIFSGRFMVIEQIEFVKELEKTMPAKWLIIYKEGEAEKKVTKMHQACNKIIHALEIYPIYLTSENSKLKYDLTIEARGIHKKREWLIQINIVDFIISIDHVLEFKY